MAHPIVKHHFFWLVDRIERRVNEGGLAQSITLRLSHNFKKQHKRVVLRQFEASCSTYVMPACASREGLTFRFVGTYDDLEDAVPKFRGHFMPPFTAVYGPQTRHMSYGIWVWNFTEGDPLLAEMNSAVRAQKSVGPL